MDRTLKTSIGIYNIIHNILHAHYCLNLMSKISWLILNFSCILIADQNLVMGVQAQKVLPQTEYLSIETPNLSR